MTGQNNSFFLFSECLCIPDGSIGIECTEVDGKCDCKENVTGDKCHECKAGYFNHPTCSGKQKYYFQL